MKVALIALVTAFLIDTLFGDPPNRFHPVVAMGTIIRCLTQAWNHGGNAHRFWAGVGLITIGGILFSIPWLLIARIGTGLPHWVIGIGTGISLKPVFAFRGLLRAGREVQQALLQSDLPEARRLVAWHLVSRDTSQLSGRQVASAVIESLAENLTDSFLAPLFYFALGGLPLAWFYRFVNTADAMIGYRSADYEYFGKFAARLDDVLNWLPARIAGLLLVAAAGLCRLDMLLAWKVMLKQHAYTSSPNAGWMIAAAAGALGIVLEKKGQYRLEGGDKLPEGRDIGRATWLVAVALALSLLFCGGMVVGIERSF